MSNTATIKSIKINKVLRIILKRGKRKREKRALLRGSLSICSSAFAKLGEFDRSRKERLHLKHSEGRDLFRRR